MRIVLESSVSDDVRVDDLLAASVPLCPRAGIDWQICPGSRDKHDKHILNLNLRVSLSVPVSRYPIKASSIVLLQKPPLFQSLSHHRRSTGILSFRPLFLNLGSPHWACPPADILIARWWTWRIQDNKLEEDGLEGGWSRTMGFQCTRANLPNKKYHIRKNAHIFI